MSLEPRISLVSSPDRHEVSWRDGTGRQVEEIDRIIEGFLDRSGTLPSGRNRRRRGPTPASKPGS